MLRDSMAGSDEIEDNARCYAANEQARVAVAGFREKLKDKAFENQRSVVSHPNQRITRRVRVPLLIGMVTRAIWQCSYSSFHRWPLRQGSEVLAEEAVYSPG
jgi:hypothetical protein